MCDILFRRLRTHPSVGDRRAPPGGEMVQHTVGSGREVWAKQQWSASDTTEGQVPDGRDSTHVLLSGIDTGEGDGSVGGWVDGWMNGWIGVNFWRKEMSGNQLNKEGMRKGWGRRHNVSHVDLWKFLRTVDASKQISLKRVFLKKSKSPKKPKIFQTYWSQWFCLKNKLRST